MYRAAAIQMDCIVGDRSRNLATADDLVQQAVDEGAKLVVLPELFSSGSYDLKSEDFSEFLYHKTTNFLIRSAKYGEILIVGSFIEKLQNGKKRNTTLLCGPGGISGIYHKVFLWSAETRILQRGHEFPVRNTDLGRIGMMTCYDIAFPESGRKLGKKRAAVAASGSAFYTEHVWDMATKARAYENSFYHVAANRIGDDTGRTFCGRSRIVDPLGRILAEQKNGEGVVLADIDLETAAKVRKEVGFFRDPR